MFINRLAKRKLTNKNGWGQPPTWFIPYKQYKPVGTPPTTSSWALIVLELCYKTEFGDQACKKRKNKMEPQTDESPGQPVYRDWGTTDEERIALARQKKVPRRRRETHTTGAKLLSRYWILRKTAKDVQREWPRMAPSWWCTWNLCSYDIEPPHFLYLSRVSIEQRGNTTNKQNAEQVAKDYPNQWVAVANNWVVDLPP